jgi:hypothetical protein
VVLTKQWRSTERSSRIDSHTRAFRPATASME